MFASKNLLSMKKCVLVISGFVIVCFVCSYLYVPNRIVINESLHLNNSAKGLLRELSTDDNWKKWWPVTKKTIQEMSFNGNTYTIVDRTITNISIEITNSNLKAKSSLDFIPTSTDSVNLKWEIEIPSSYNPIKRLQIYFTSKNIQKDCSLLLNSIKSYYSNTLNTYGIDIHREFVKDSLLIFTFDSSKGYPSTKKIYFLIEQLRNYASNQNVKMTDSPMLNVYTADSLHYLTKVAIPIEKKLSSNGNILFKQMLGRGNILTAEVKGDQKKVDSALGIIESYMRDYHLTAPAIPFYSLTSNRITNSDSSTWVTKIYYPIMYY